MNKPNTDLADAIQVIVDLWTKQKPCSKYGRLYNTDWATFLHVWEGTENGSYYYQWDENGLYKELICGTSATFYFFETKNGIEVRLDSKLIDTYENPLQVSLSLQNNWNNLRLCIISEERYKFEELLKKEQSLIKHGLSQLARDWQAGSMFEEFLNFELKKHFAVNQVHQYFYLALWLGNHDDVWFVRAKPNETGMMVSSMPQFKQMPYRYTAFAFRFGSNPIYLIQNLETPSKFSDLRGLNTLQTAIDWLRDYLSPAQFFPKPD